MIMNCDHCGGMGSLEYPGGPPCPSCSWLRDLESFARALERVYPPDPTLAEFNRIVEQFEDELVDICFAGPMDTGELSGLPAYDKETIWRPQPFILPDLRGRTVPEPPQYEACEQCGIVHEPALFGGTSGLCSFVCENGSPCALRCRQVGHDKDGQPIFRCRAHGG